MPEVWIFLAPRIKMQHQLSPNRIQKLAKSATQMETPLSEAPTLPMPDEKRIHQKDHIPVATDRFLVSHLVLVESQIIFRMLIKLIDFVSETPTPQQK